MPSFDKTWAQQETPGITEKIRGAVKPEGPLKPRIQNAVNKLQVQISKLDLMLAKLKDRDAHMFGQIVTAMQHHDTNASRSLSVELAEVRKVKKTLGNARMSLEQVRLRLTTIHDLGETMVAIGPAMSTMKGLQSSLGRFMPEADSELNSMTQTLGGLMTDSIGEGSFNIEEQSNEETARILEEASVVATQQIGDKFPSVPAAAGMPAESSSSYE
ncbi:conserved protein implicated in secretion [Cenarchaeum symbiosum A]|uniref:Conserved protein implicated in secretion n=1 Tax=Cenarchaeum symbiosum (strain A) TaxID=414004 RepID=A0RYV7_CENSY|nr:conserved protein implicated in secretion [Cenarchaeum symbiosum A]